MRNADICAAVVRRFDRVVVRRAVGKFRRLHPYGKSRARSGGKSDGRRGRIFLRRAVRARGIGVVNHQHALLIRRGVALGIVRSGINVGVGNIVERNVVVVLVKFEVVHLFVLVVFLPALDIVQPVVGVHALPLRFGFRLGHGVVPARFGKILPCVRVCVDHAACRLAGKRRGKRPTLRRGDDRRIILLGIEFKIAVFHFGRVARGVGRNFRLIHIRLVRVFRAGG